MTPREFERAQWAYFQILKREVRLAEDRVIKVAWWHVHLYRHKRLPSLKILLTPPVVLTGEALKAAQEQHERVVKEMGN